MLREHLATLPQLGRQLRKRGGGIVVDRFFRYSAQLSRLHPLARVERHGLELFRDLAYRATELIHHRLDIYRPAGRTGPLPVVLYIHGGGFRMLSKESHWMMAFAFARRGFLVVNINYRLAPLHPYPAALEDVCAAYVWLVRHAKRLGADLDRLVVAGESAGANLATALSVATTYPRPEPFAREVFDTGVPPRALVAACGMLQVSDPHRFLRRRRLPAWLFDRLEEVTDAYLGGADADAPGGLELADPLVALERGGPPTRAFPATFAFAGTRDPLLDDSRRLHAAVQRAGAPSRMRVYPGEMHAFHAFAWREQALCCWRDMFRFLGEHVPDLDRQQLEVPPA